MANTFGTQNTVSFALRHKYFQSSLQQQLRNSLVSTAIFKTDTSNQKTIENPYISTGGTASVASITGDYTISAMATTEDSLQVTDSVIVPTHVYDFEAKTANFDLMADFLDDLAYQVRFNVDKWVLNRMLDIATGSYSTAAGGFTTPSNIPKIMGDLLGKVAGYAGGIGANPFLVIESTDLTGFAQLQVASGFNYADSALNNGFLANYMGVDIHVIRTGTFVTATFGTQTLTNANHRLFGLKNLGVIANPGGFTYEEKTVSLKTGKEVVAFGYVGAKIWAPHLSLFVDITLQ
jgi:hypothetical protein